MCAKAAGAAATPSGSNGDGVPAAGAPEQPSPRSLQHHARSSPLQRSLLPTWQSNGASAAGLCAGAAQPVPPLAQHHFFLFSDHKRSPCAAPTVQLYNGDAGAVLAAGARVVLASAHPLPR
mmetsp:Transcript_104379/g.290716  ORF Transcript_104379/g.290716 Transcript_104379/m.290716 type:complete len:121 (-) Transcript_104379:660-1022(-)